MIDMIKIVHNDYEKISDTIMWLNSSFVLKFNVVLNRYSDKFGRTNFHKEVAYYKDNNCCININREFDYFLSVESMQKDREGFKLAVQIKMNDIYFFKFKLNQVSEWFTAEKNISLFAKKDGKIFMPSKTNPIRVSLSYGNFIEFEPSILNLDNGSQSIGVRMYVNSESEGSFISVDRLLSIKYFIDNFNMYESAQLMLNYVNRPTYGTNLYDMTGNKQNSNKFLK